MNEDMTWEQTMEYIPNWQNNVKRTVTSDDLKVWISTFDVLDEINLITGIPLRRVLEENIQIINPSTTGDAYMRQLFHGLQWYAGSE